VSTNVLWMSYKVHGRSDMEWNKTNVHRIGCLHVVCCLGEDLSDFHCRNKTPWSYEDKMDL